MAIKRQFQAELLRPDAAGTWTYFIVPFNVEEAYGSKAQVKVKGTVNGVPYRSSVMPNGDGTHSMVVNGTIREAAGVTAGDTVIVTMEPDTTPREVEVPDDFAEALEQHQAAKEAFDSMSYSHKKEYVEWIVSAKKAETRAGRIDKAMGMLLEKKKLK